MGLSRTCARFLCKACSCVFDHALLHDSENHICIQIECPKCGRRYRYTDQGSACERCESKIDCLDLPSIERTWYSQDLKILGKNTKGTFKRWAEKYKAPLKKCCNTAAMFLLGWLALLILVVVCIFTMKLTLVIGKWVF
jgi:hypothetical protein